jgi:hypothetical protein
VGKQDHERSEQSEREKYNDPKKDLFEFAVHGRNLARSF